MCKKHLDMTKTGEVVKCDQDGTWHLASEACPKCGQVLGPTPGLVQEENPFLDEPAPHIIEKDGKTHCLICGKETANGHHFCLECYKRYSNKVIMVRIDKCADATVEDEDYESGQTCADGHKVRSKAEQIIDDYMFNHGIPHVYEKTVHFGPGEREIMKPDFCLPDYKNCKGESIGEVFIEYFGYQQGGDKYKRMNAFKIEKYQKMNFTVICLYEEDVKNIASAMEGKLGFCEPHKIVGYRK
jgi:hypothetical protein